MLSFGKLCRRILRKFKSNITYIVLFDFQAQVSLDHDYCTPGNKANKRHRWNSSTPQVKEVPQQPQRPKWTTVPNNDQPKQIPSSQSVLSNINKVASTPIVIAASSASRPMVRVVRGGAASVNRYLPGVTPTPIRVAAPTPTPLTIHNPATTTTSIASSIVKSSPSQQQQQLRGENDPKKDSGLESGEVSDASEGLHPGALIKNSFKFLKRSS